MRVRSLLSVVSASAVGVALAALPAAASGAGHPADRVLVKFTRSTTAATAASIEQRYGATQVGTVRDLGVRVLSVPAGSSDRVATALSRQASVSFAEPDGSVQGTQAPNDTYWSSQWGPPLVNAPTAWDTTTGSSSAVIAVLDTGVDFTQSDLSGKLAPGYDFINNDSDPTDDYGHGTETAGIAGAASNNGSGIAGMCWSCTVMPVKVLDSTNNGTWSALANGITWATDHGAKVISMSLSGSGGSSTVQSAVQYAESHDVVLVAAAGNNANSTPVYPAAYAGVISVAGTTNTDTLYSWSDYGSWVSVAAPGCDYATHMGGGYGTFCGTSASTPVVAGIVGLLRSANPSASATQVASAIESSATNIGSVVAYGRVDAAGALSALGGASSTSSSPSPAPTAGPATTTATFSGSLSSKQPTRTYTVSSGAGSMSVSLSFTKASSLTATVTDGAGQTVMTASGASPASASATVAAGSYKVTVSGSTRASYTLTVTTPTA